MGFHKENGIRIGYKKVRTSDCEEFVIKLGIIGDVVTPTPTPYNKDKKRRTNKAIVLGVVGRTYGRYGWLKVVLKRGEKPRRVLRSFYRHSFMYRIGKTVTPDRRFDEDPSYACASGIHFFDDLWRAVEYSG